MIFSPKAIRLMTRALVCIGFLTVRSAPFACASAADISYTISLASPEQHLVEVQIMLPPGTDNRELQLPVWNALYQIRDFSQYINWVRAKDRSGKPLEIREINPSRWQVHGTANGAIVEYQIYEDSPGPFGAQLNGHHAFFNLAQLLMYAVDARDVASIPSLQPCPQRLAHRDSPELPRRLIPRGQLRPSRRLARGDW